MSTTLVTRLLKRIASCAAATNSSAEQRVLNEEARTPAVANLRRPRPCGLGA